SETRTTVQRASFAILFWHKSPPFLAFRLELLDEAIVPCPVEQLRGEIGLLRLGAGNTDALGRWPEELGQPLDAQLVFGRLRARPAGLLTGFRRGVAVVLVALVAHRDAQRRGLEAAALADLQPPPLGLVLRVGVFQLQAAAHPLHDAAAD